MLTFLSVLHCLRVNNSSLLSLRGFAPAGGRSDADCPGSQDYTFGFLPHQIRGFLSQFSEVVPCTAAFSRCSACSQPVLDAYAKGGFDFLLRVFDEPGYLEEVSGLKELQLETYFDEVLSLSDDDADICAI